MRGRCAGFFQRTGFFCGISVFRILFAQFFETVYAMWNVAHKAMLKLETVEGTGKYVEKSVESVNTQSISRGFQQKACRKYGKTEKMQEIRSDFSTTFSTGVENPVERVWIVKCGFGNFPECNFFRFVIFVLLFCNLCVPAQRCGKSTGKSLTVYYYIYLYIMLYIMQIVRQICTDAIICPRCPEWSW